MLLETIWNNLLKNKKKKKNQVKIISIKIIYVPDGIERTGRKGILCTVKYLCIYATQLRKAIFTEKSINNEYYIF